MSEENPIYEEGDFVEIVNAVNPAYHDKGDVEMLWHVDTGGSRVKINDGSGGATWYSFCDIKQGVEELNEVDDTLCVGGLVISRDDNESGKFYVSVDTSCEARNEVCLNSEDLSKLSHWAALQRNNLQTTQRRDKIKQRHTGIKP